MRRRDPILIGVGVLVAAGVGLIATQLVVLVLASLRRGFLLDEGGFGLGNFAEILARPALQTVLANTALLGLGSVAVMLFFAIPFAWLYARTDLPAKGLLLLLLTVKTAIPGFLVALGYIVLLNPRNGLANEFARSVLGAAEPPFNVYALGWIIFFQGASLVTSAFFMMVPAFRAIDAAFEEAAAVSGARKLRIFARVLLPLALPAVLATALYYLMVSIEAFDYAVMLGLPARILVLATWIFELARPPYADAVPNYGEAAALGVLSSIVVGCLTLLYLRMIRRSERYAVVTGRRGEQVPTRLSRGAKLIAWSFIALFLAIELVVPLLMLLWSSLLPYLQLPSRAALAALSLDAYQTAFDELPPVLANTALVMVAVPTLVLLSAAATSWLLTRTRLPGRRPIELVLMTGVAVPNVVGALAFLYLGLSVYRFVPIYTSVWIMVLALSTRSMTWANRTLSASMLQVDRELEEAAQIAGVTRGRTFLAILLPTVKPALLFSWFWVALLAVRELSVPLMLRRPSTELLSTLIWGFNNSGETATASALGVLMLVIIAVLAMAFHRFVRRVAL